MIYTARQLEQLLRANGQVVLPYRARLSPLAKDFIRAKKIEVGYSDVDPAAGSGKVAADMPLDVKESASTKPLLWWCDGPCGAAKAAISAVSREIGLSPIAIPQDAKKIAAAVRHLAGEVKAGRASGGLFVVTNAAAALIYANRCASLRAILGTSLTAVDEAIRELSPNVLAVEHTRQTLQQMKNMMLRFAKAQRTPSQTVRQDLKEMAQCG